MILTPHLLAGAALASKIQIAPLALILAFLSHYFLDFIPHQDHCVKHIKERQWRKSFLEFLKIGVDFCFGIFLIFMFFDKQPIIYAGAFLAILADGLAFLNLIFPNKALRAHEIFHRKIHFLEYKKIPRFWRIFSQILIIFIAILFLS